MMCFECDRDWIGLDWIGLDNGYGFSVYTLQLT